ncbi:helical backbone metal receptor [Salinimonas chungwhensis]|uniref:helical backbone metal receptor n=1 Tax=Salinimonas chungwhensis TaxID=265425 RepID=UPI00036EE209|nr:helical backbone metal receptor [Salinimonas chungwhensis]
MYSNRKIWCLVLVCWTWSASAKTIVSLSPHLTEWVYSLKQEQNLLAVSSHSDFPPQAANLPVVADAHGANIKAIVKLNPDIILAWRGGNKPQDIARLEQLGFSVFESQPQLPSDISNELRSLGRILGAQQQARKLTKQFDQQLSQLTAQYREVPPVTAFYYLWTAPLMSVGEKAWASRLLSQCNISTLFADSPVDYPQVSVQEVIRRQPQVLVAATSRSLATEQAFWQSHADALDVPVLRVNPDIFSRFTLRLAPALKKLCAKIHATRFYAE